MPELERVVIAGEPVAPPVWTDVSSWSKDVPDAARTPKIWQARFYALRVTVHRHITHAPDQWLLSTGPDLFDCSPLVAKDIDAAKLEALHAVEDRLRLILGELSKAILSTNTDTLVGALRNASSTKKEGTGE